MIRRSPFLVLLLAFACTLVGPHVLADPPPSASAPAVPAPTAPSPRFVGPRTGPARLKALTRFGGGEASERAVEAALDWLARHEDGNGGWDADGFPAKCDPQGPKCTGLGKGQHGEEMPCPFDGAISALATMAFLGAGHGPWVAGDRHGALVERALARLRTATDVWARPLATQALAEAEVLEGKGRFVEAVKEGVAKLVGARGPDGGWGYASRFRPGSDVPYAALVIPALVTARDVGVEMPATLGADVDAWLTTLENADGRLAYLKDGRAYGYTPTTANGLAAAAMREWLGVGRDGARHRAHLALASRDRPDWVISFKDVEVPGQGKVRVQMGHLSLYEWWYGSMATFQAGGEAWSGWFGKLRAALIPNQVKTGCARGSWDPLGTYERQTGGRVFSTALCALMLETPCRHRRLSDK